MSVTTLKVGSRPRKSVLRTQLRFLNAFVECRLDRRLEIPPVLCSTNSQLLPHDFGGSEERDAIRPGQCGFSEMRHRVPAVDERVKFRLEDSQTRNEPASARERLADGDCLHEVAGGTCLGGVPSGVEK